MAFGRPTLYNPDFHPAECLRLMKEGYFAIEVAVHFGISMATLYVWCDAHPDFLESYTEGKQARTAFFLNTGREAMVTPRELNFNDRIFGMMMKYDGVDMNERRVKLPELATCKTFSEQGTVIIGALACGKINLKEAMGFVDIIGKLAKIDEMTELRRMLEEIELEKKKGR